MKKRILVLTLALMLIIAMAVPAMATGGTITQEGEQTKGTTLTYTVAQTYTVTIPEAVTIEGAERKGTGVISVANAIIPFGESLTVTITGATNYDTGFRLRDGENNNYIGYTIKNGDDAVEKDAAFLTVAAGTATGSATLTYTAEAPTKAGEYTDNLTFTVAVGAPVAP